MLHGREGGEGPRTGTGGNTSGLQKRPARGSSLLQSTCKDGELHVECVRVKNKCDPDALDPTHFRVWAPFSFIPPLP